MGLGARRMIRLAHTYMVNKNLGSQPPVPELPEPPQLSVWSGWDLVESRSPKATSPVVMHGTSPPRLSHLGNSLWGNSTLPSFASLCLSLWP